IIEPVDGQLINTGTGDKGNSGEAMNPVNNPGGDGENVKGEMTEPVIVDTDMEPVVMRDSDLS
ncbi:hypothetical protein N0V85_008702, partial [Neurospora sp. IMI 360204]